MKLVLLPGLDGTGELLEPLLQHIGVDAEIIKLPLGGAQDYQSLHKYVLAQLPAEEYVLLAESFSGPIAATIAAARPPALQGVIFVATFLSPPPRLLLGTATLLPIRRLSQLRLSSPLLKGLLLGRKASDELLARFREVVAGLSEEVIHKRIRAIKQLGPMKGKSDLPVLYLRASRDRLIANDKWREFRSAFKQFSLTDIEGPHFLLQAEPQKCAALINLFIDGLG